MADWFDRVLWDVEEPVDRVLWDLGLNPLAELRPESLDEWWQGYLTALRDVWNKLHPDNLIEQP